MIDDDTLRTLAASQHHCFTLSQAIACGYPDRQVRRFVQGGLWLPAAARGVYAEAAVVATLDATERHLLAVHARLLQLGRGWVAARRSAALGYGLPLLGDLPARPQLARDKHVVSDRGRNRFERRSSLPPEDLGTANGLPATALARTVVDLARDESFRSGLVVADGSLRQGLDPEVLRAQADRSRGWPGGLQALRVVRFADGRAESAFESISRWRMHLEGLSAPEPQVEVYLGTQLLARTDFFWREFNLVGESDGKGKYRMDPERGYAEKLQRERLENVGLTVVSWSWPAAYRDDGDLGATIRRGMARGALNTVDPRVRFVSTTVADALRRTRPA